MQTGGFYEEDEPIDKIRDILKHVDFVTTCPTCGAGCGHDRIIWVDDFKEPILSAGMGFSGSKHPECADCHKVFELIQMNTR